MNLIQRSIATLTGGRLEPLVTELEHLGFYRYTAPSRLAASKRSGTSGGYLYLHTRREFHADEEDLAEGGVANLVRRARPFLRAEGVPVRSVRQRFTDHEPYSVTVDGSQQIIYTLDEVGTDELWEYATGRAFQLLNRLLIDVGSEERAYLLSGWNDGELVFLTPAMFELIRANPLIPEKDKPRQLVKEELSGD